MKITTKRYLLGSAAGLALLVGISGSAKALIPVVDDAALLEWAQSFIDDAKAYALQLQSYVTQAKQYIGDELSWVTQASQYAMQAQQYAQEIQMFLNFAHNPSLGAAMGILGTVGLGNSMPINPYAVMGLMSGLQYGAGGFGELSGLLGSLSGLAGTAYSSAHIYTPTDGSWASQQVVARANGIAGAQGTAAAAFSDLKTHQTALQPLRDRLLEADTTKDVLDASAQIQVETAWNVNETAQLQAANAIYQAQSDSIVQRDNEKMAKDFEEFLASSPVPSL